MRRTNAEGRIRGSAVRGAAAALVAFGCATDATGAFAVERKALDASGAPAQSGSIVVLNEFLADPPPDPDGDANGDGVRNSADDEFVELFNASGGVVDLTGWTLQDATNVRHTFEEGVVLGPGAFYVVFGGGTPTGIPSASTVASSGGLSLNNTADEVKLVGPDLTIRDARAYGPEGNEDQSIIRYPDGHGDWTLPEDVGMSWKYSPGAANAGATSVDDTSWGEVKALYRE